MTQIEIDKLTYEIIGAAYEVRKTLGKFLYEEVYELALQSELKSRGIKSERQLYYPVYYKGDRLEKAYKIDLLVEGVIPIELKALKCMYSDEFCQLMSYLVYGNFKFGYLINFGANDFSTERVPKNMEMTKGIYRIFRKDSYTGAE